jgi:hypothetical protein
MPLLLDGQRGARGREKSEMDEPRRYLHGTLVGLCRRRSPTAARRGRGERAAAAARVRAPPESALGSDAGAERENCFIVLHFIFQDIILFSNMLLTIVTLKAIFIGPQRAMNMCCSLPKHMCISAYIYIFIYGLPQQAP